MQRRSDEIKPPIPTALPQTIDEVIAHLDQVIEWCIRANSRLGYFATLYRNVTVKVRADIAAGRFEDGPRMERLDVVFANLYLDALYKFWRGQPTAACWDVAFRAARRRTPIILQHLLLGMNAHINLDLAHAAVQTSGSALPGLERDFYEITTVLHEMIDDVQARVAHVSPWLRIMDRAGGRTDEQLCAFAIGKARDQAWSMAEELAIVPPDEFARKLAAHDQVVAALGRRIRSPGRVLGAALYLVRARESRPVPEVIAALRLEYRVESNQT